MPTANDSNLLGECLGLAAPAGEGKSIFAIQSPQPHAMFLLDKASYPKLPADFPNYDKNLTFWTPYLPPDIDITKDNMDRDRSIMDKIKSDVMAIRNALYVKKPEFTMVTPHGKETWLLPKTVIFEAGDFIRNHLVDHYLRRHSKHEMSDFDKETLTRWGSIGKEALDILSDIVCLPALCPVNVVITIGWAEDVQTKMEGGKLQLIRTGKFDPDFGGKLDQVGPRKFKDFWMPHREAGKFWMATQQGTRWANYRGLRSGRFDVQPEEDVTLVKPYVNQWNRLFSGGEK